jgi:Transposase DDE domain
MKTSNCWSSKVKQNYEKFFDKKTINRIGRVSGFICRRGARITPFAFVLGLIQCCCAGCNTYSAWAAAIGTLTGKEVSKQALFKRMNEHTVSLSRQFFERVLTLRLQHLKQGRVFKLFKRVLLADSTTLSLPQVLAKDFPGNVSHGVKKAVARLQCILDLRAMQWLYLSVDAFTDNDQGASGKVVPLLKKGDLLIRDLGYFVLQVLTSIINSQAFFISRLRYGLNWYDSKTGKQINWKDLLPAKRRTVVDKTIVIGKEEQLLVRVILIPLPAPQVEARIRKAKKDWDKRCNHGADYYRWLGYNVFITNVDKDMLSASEVAEVYGIRWFIELLFKAWKSGGHLQAMLHQGCTNVYRVKTTIYLLLVFYCLVIQQVYVRHFRSIEKRTGSFLSLIKLLAFVCNNLIKVISASDANLKEILCRYCCYEQRLDRRNIIEFIYTI